MRLLLVWIVVSLLILGGGAAWLLKAQAPVNPVVSPPTLAPNLITVNTPTEVTATVSIPDPTLNPTSVNLLRVNASATTAVVAELEDKGKGGDQKPGDKVFTAKFNLNETQVGIFGFQVSATFRGKNQTLSAVQQFVVLAPHSLLVVLPPDPGEAGKATLAGIDSDNDGVRDDILRAIVFARPDSERTREAMKQAARGFRPYLVATTTASARIANDELSKASSCLYLLDGNTAAKMFDVVQLTAVNTNGRSRAFFRVDALLGTRFGRTFINPCTFNPSALPN